MSGSAGQIVDDAITFLITAALAAVVLTTLVRYLSRRHPDLRIGLPVAVGLTIRVAMAAAVSLTAYGSTLRGGDEIAFSFRADVVRDTAFGSPEWVDALINELHVFVIAIQRELIGSTDLALRVTEAGIAVAGLAFLAAAVHMLAGPRASAVSAWLLALEPASVFFSTLLHKESLIILAIGLVAYGGAQMWKRPDPRPLIVMALGIGVAAAVRGHVSWFLIVAAALITLHSGLRVARHSAARAFVALSAVAIVVAITFPLVTGRFADQSIQRLDVSQRANAQDDSNLQLEAVDFSTGTGIITNLPTRLREVILRPYPWELDNVSQQLGLMGSLVVLISAWFLVRELVRNWGNVMERAGPLVYVALSLLVVYSLAAGNAGTAFRYRVQIVAVVLCVISALAFARSAQRASRPIAKPAERPPLGAAAG